MPNGKQLNPLNTYTMKTIKNLKQALKLAGTEQVTAQQLINGRLYISISPGWVNIKLSNEFKIEMIEDIINILGGQQRTKKRVYNTLFYSTPQHWGLNRILLENYNNKPKWGYCAGQDYAAELQQIRSDLK